MPTPPEPVPGVPRTIDALNRVAAKPFHEAQRLISLADSALVKAWGERLYGSKFGHGYLHSTDHYAALEILLGRVPTYREVYDSYHQGSRNIDFAREKEGKGARPDGWDTLTPTTKLYHVLVHRYGVVRGSKIFDGKLVDTDPVGTRRQLDEWNGTTGTKPEPEPEPEKPKPPVDPIPPPSPGKLVTVRGTLTLNVDGVERRFNVTEIVE